MPVEQPRVCIFKRKRNPGFQHGFAEHGYKSISQHNSHFNGSVEKFSIREERQLNLAIRGGFAKTIEGRTTVEHRAIL